MLGNVSKNVEIVVQPRETNLKYNTTIRLFHVYLFDHVRLLLHALQVGYRAL